MGLESRIAPHAAQLSARLGHWGAEESAKEQGLVILIMFRPYTVIYVVLWTRRFTDPIALFPKPRAVTTCQCTDQRAQPYSSSSTPRSSRIWRPATPLNNALSVDWQICYPQPDTVLSVRLRIHSVSIEMQWYSIYPPLVYYFWVVFNHISHLGQTKSQLD